MPWHRSTFTKMIGFLIAILIPVLVLYSFSNKVSMDVLHSEITELKEKDIILFASELESSLNDIFRLGLLLSQDIHIQKLRTVHLLKGYERYSEKLRMLERLQLLNAAGKWDTQYSIMSPENGEMVSTSSSLLEFDREVLKSRYTNSWELHANSTSNFGYKDERFIRHLVHPMYTSLDKAGLVVEMSFNLEELVRDLDTFKLGGNGDPFLLAPDGRIVTNSTPNDALTQSIVELLSAGDAAAYNNRIIELSGSKYLINVREVPSLGWHVIDYVPIDTITRPIITSRNLFYGSIGLLLLMSIFAAYMLYKKVQQPILQLIRSVHKLKIGDYSVRLTNRPNNEFDFLFDRFNEMAAEIEQLIQKVYVEQLRSREANLKQLQSQINPHFLYNCFALIRSLTRLGKKESVMELALHLSKYYRYTTRLEKQTATLREELELIESYLKIQQMHIHHLQYETRVPRSMEDLEIPRLLLQPLVENAVVHGIEKIDRDGMVAVYADQNEHYYVIQVIDNGAGMSEEELEKVRHEIEHTPDDESGCALWNIRQRLRLQFGPQADMEFRPREDSGVLVELRWPRNQTLEEPRFAEPLLQSG